MIPDCHLQVLGGQHQRGEQRLKVGLEEAETSPRHRNNCQVDDSGRNMETTPLPNTLEASKATLGRVLGGGGMLGYSGIHCHYTLTIWEN